MHKHLFTFLLFLFFTNKSFCQDAALDVTILQSRINQTHDYNAYYQGVYNNQKTLKNSSRLQKINPIFYLAKTAMFTYQNIISPQLSKDCPYQVTCSNFAKTAIQKKGFLLGVFLGADRLLRCNSFSFIGAENQVVVDEHNKIIDPLFSFK